MMRDDLKRAADILSNSSNTCVIIKGDKIYTSTEHGIKPLMNFIQKGDDLSGFCAADRIVGKAAAMLYAILGIEEVFAQVLSKTGAKALEQNKINYCYKEMVKSIRNRADTGLCPMEEAVGDVSSPFEAYEALKQKIASMTNREI